MEIPTVRIKSGREWARVVVFIYFTRFFTRMTDLQLFTLPRSYGRLSGSAFLLTSRKGNKGNTI